VADLAWESASSASRVAPDSFLVVVQLSNDIAIDRSSRTYYYRGEFVPFPHSEIQFQHRHFLNLLMFISVSLSPFLSISATLFFEIE